MEKTKKTASSIDVAGVTVYSVDRREHKEGDSISDR